MPDDNRSILAQVPRFEDMSQAPVAMSMRERFANALAGGELAELKKKNNDLISVIRPGLPTFDYAPQYTGRGFYYWCYFFEHEVSILSDLYQKKRDEVFRKGVQWVPKFVMKCEKCDTEYQRKVDKCDCGSSKLREPDKEELKYWKRDDYDDFFTKANLNGQTFIDVMRQEDLHVSISDNFFLLVIQKYMTDDAGAITASLPSELMALDPRDVQIVEYKGLPGKRGKHCLLHRDVLQNPDEERCGVEGCGKLLYPTWYMVQCMDNVTYYYGQDEIIHCSFAYPSLLYGYPKCLKIVDELWTYHYIEKRVRNYYENARPPGFIFVPTANQDALIQMWAKVMEQIKQRPNDIPVIATSEAAPTEANFIKLLTDPNADLIAVKEELRERIASSVGMTINFTNDTTNSGGLKNDANMISLGDRTMQDWQQDFYDGKIFSKIAKLFHIKDHKLVCVPNVEENEMQKAELFAIETQNAKLMQELGYDIEYEPADKGYGKFHYSGEAKSPEERQESQLALQQQYAPKQTTPGMQAKKPKTPGVNRPKLQKAEEKEEEEL